MDNSSEPLLHGSLFSGIGGFDLAAEQVGWVNAFHCEINPFGQKVLKNYFPNSILYDDITQTDFTIWRGRIGILSGGFPCQPYSTAGKRQGKDDDRHLWPQMLRAIREIRPRYIVGENVRGLINWNGGLVFDEVQADLEAEGYEVLPFLLPAASVGAPHERYRVWFVAYRSDTGIEGLRHEWENAVYEFESIANSSSVQNNGRGSGRFHTEPSGIDAERATPNSTSDRRERTGEGIEIEKGLQPRSEPTGELGGRLEGLCSDGDATNTCDIKLQRSIEHGSIEEKRATESEIGQFSRPICTKWEEFPTQSPVCSGNDGLCTESLRERIRRDSMGVISEKEIDQIISKAATSLRNESIKAYGNAVVPPLVIEIFKIIDQMLKKNRKPTGEKALFEMIWNKREHRSFVSGLPIREPMTFTFAHVLSKGAYPAFRLNPENVVLLTQEEHSLYDHGGLEGREKYAKANPNVDWDKLYELKESLQEKYRSVQSK